MADIFQINHETNAQRGSVTSQGGWMLFRQQFLSFCVSCMVSLVWSSCQSWEGTVPWDCHHPFSLLRTCSQGLPEWLPAHSPFFHYVSSQFVLDQQPNLSPQYEAHHVILLLKILHLFHPRCSPQFLLSLTAACPQPLASPHIFLHTFICTCSVTPLVIYLYYLPLPPSHSHKTTWQEWQPWKTVALTVLRSRTIAGRWQVLLNPC